MQPDREWLKAAVGPNADKYLRQFEKIDRRGALAPTWHWPALFCSMPWFWYRGMSGFTFLDSLLLWSIWPTLFMRGSGPRIYAVVALFVLFVAVPMYANALYYQLLKKRYARQVAKPGDRASRFDSTSSIATAIVGTVLTTGFVFALVLMWSSQYMYADYTLRSRFTELIAAAGVCKTSVGEFYQAKGRMPVDEREAVCSTEGTASSTAPRVANGTIRVEAKGKLREDLEEAESGIEFRTSPVCEGGACQGKPIVAWDCKSGTTVSPKFLPAACR